MNNKTMKQFISGLIITVSIATVSMPSYADASTVTSLVENSSVVTVESVLTSSMGLNTMINKAYESQIDLVLLRTQFEREKHDYKTAMAIANALESDRDIDDVLTYENNVSIKQTPIEAELEYLDKQYEIMTKKNEIDQQVHNLYYTYFNLQEDLTSKQKYYEFMTDKRKSKSSELNLGQITQLQFDEFEKTYQSAFLDYMNATNLMNSKVREINVYLDMDPETKISLVKTDMLAQNIENINLEVTNALIQENAYAIRQLELQKSSKEMEAFLKQRFKGFGEKAIEINLLEDAVTELEHKITDEQRNLKYNLYTKYNDAVISLKNIEIKNMEYDLAKRTYNINELKFDNGLISLIDLTESRKAFEASYYNINDAKLQNYLKVESLFNFIEENTTIQTVN